jgi:cytochrome c-type biogenesis protein CcmF
VADLGRTALWLALVAGMGAAVAGLLPAMARRAAWLLGLSVAACALATGVLVRALVANDFSLTYVADFSREEIGAPYRVAALWGGMAGSLLWFATLVGLAGLVAAWRTSARRAAARPLICAVTGGTVAALAALVLAFADPFRRLEVPAIDGAGLVPILEHPAMLYHPPLLYLGLATLVGPFAFTVAALAEDGLDASWAATVRAWLLLPWTLLAVGMLAGAHWAYVELGWGGYWAWDPVENTALLPWLGVTLCLHALRRFGLSPAAPAGNGGPARPPVRLAGLACLPFVLALLGALLTRSGATSSVHAFAESRTIGRALGALVAAASLGMVALLVRAAGTRRGSAPPTSSRRLGRRPTVPTLLAGHLAVVGGLLAIVLAGTLWPLGTDLIGGDGIAIEGRYFASFAGPLAAAGLVLLAVFPLVRARGTAAERPIVAAAGLGLGAGIVAAMAGTGDRELSAAVLMGLGGTVVATSGLAVARRLPGLIGAHVAHAGLGLLMVGIGGTTTGETTTVALSPGESVEVAGRTVTNRGLSVADGPVDASEAVVADVDVDGRGLAPSIVAFPERNVLLAETSLISGPFADVQVALRDAQDDGTALLEVGVHPLQVLVWWGALVLVAGGALGLLGTKAVGQPIRSQTSAVVASRGAGA